MEIEINVVDGCKVSSAARRRPQVQRRPEVWPGERVEGEREEGKKPKKTIAHHTMSSLSPSNSIDKSDGYGGIN